MRSMRRAFLLTLPLAASIFAQPVIYNRMTVNAASYMPQGLPGGGIALGSLFSVFGSGLGQSTPAQATSYPLLNTLGGVSMTLTQGTTTVNAIPVYVNGSQINAIMPSNAPLGIATLRVQVNNLQSNPVPLRIVNDAFGIVTIYYGSGPGVVQNFVTAANQPVNAPTVAAQPGQTVILWGTGLGPVPGGNDTVTPPVGNLPTQVEVFVGGQAATTIAYSGRAPGIAAEDEIIFTVPANAPLGCWVPVLVRTSGATVSNAATMAIQSNGSTCADSQNPFSQALVKGLRSGAFAGIRATTHQSVGTIAPIDITVDHYAAGFYTPAANLFPFSSAASIPPPGACTTYTVAGDLLSGDTLPNLVPAGTMLDSGPPFTLTGSQGVNTLTQIAPPLQVGYLGGYVPGIVPNTLFFNPPGAYTVNGLGGMLVGLFQAIINVPAAPTWTNRDQISPINRAQPLTISWTSPGSQITGVVGFGVDLPGNATTGFGCLAQPGASSITIPAYILANVPPTRQNVLQSKGVIYLVSLPQSSIANFAATGLDVGVAAFTYIQGVTVVFQ